MARQRKEIDIRDVFQPKNEPIPLEEIGAGTASLEIPDKDADFVQLAQDEAFMNEKVKILVSQGQAEGELAVISPSVNGIQQPIVRGVEQVVKRKYLEALVHTVTTSYNQTVQNPAAPDQISMVPRTTHTFPVSLVEDRNPRGRSWFARLTERAARQAA
jgi:hypothetical protein